MIDEKPTQYHSYLLRIWRSDAAHSARWLVSLEDTRTGERRAFAGLAEAFALLEEQMAAGLREKGCQDTSFSDDQRSGQPG
jgi:hypothetical protein